MGNAIKKKRIALFGSTGSIGKQAIEVIRANQALFEVEILTAQSNHELLITMKNNSLKRSQLFSFTKFYNFINGEKWKL
jgi:1-deoxy-D-xylulose 5-phosphate reductoisomerase